MSHCTSHSKCFFSNSFLSLKLIFLFFNPFKLFLTHLHHPFLTIHPSFPTITRTLARFLHPLYEQHHYFGLSPSQVIFFSQGTLPCIDNDGHVILSSPFEVPHLLFFPHPQIATAPDGNGGLFMALHRSHTTINAVESEASVISHMQQHGVRFVQIYGVDNAIVRVPDPVMFGLFMQEGDDAGNKCVAKNGPHERVGVVCKKGGKYNVVEYSELSEEMATQTDAEGNLVLSAGFICNLYYTVDFLVTKCSPETLPLLYHVARKAIPYYDEAAKATVKPKEPNGVKMESFIFDVFPMSEKMGCLLVPRSEFTPVKNGNGRDGGEGDRM